MNCRAFGGSILRRLLSAAQRTMYTPQRLYGAAVLRILMGGSTLIFLMGNYGNRHLLWGPDAIGVEDLSHPSPMNAISDVWLFELVFHVSVAVVAAFAIVGGRLLALRFAFSVWMVQNRNLAVLDGGANLVQLIALVLPFLLTSVHLSPIAQRSRRRLNLESEASLSVRFGLHNAAMAIVLFQTSVVYLTAALWKISGEAWIHGVALEIVAASPRFGLVGLFRSAMAIPAVVTISSYLTVFVQLAFVPLVLARRPRYRLMAVSLVVFMHAGIVVMMGLVSFGVAMIGADSAFLTDDDYKSKAGVGARWVRRVRDAAALGVAGVIPDMRMSGRTRGPESSYPGDLR